MGVQKPPRGPTACLRRVDRGGRRHVSGVRIVLGREPNGLGDLSPCCSGGRPFPGNVVSRAQFATARRRRRPASSGVLSRPLSLPWAAQKRREALVVGRQRHRIEASRGCGRNRNRRLLWEALSPYRWQPILQTASQAGAAVMVSMPLADTTELKRRRRYSASAYSFRHRAARTNNTACFD